MRRVALLTLLCFGCATSRPPVPDDASSPAAPPPARVGLAEPELELWMEGTRPADPVESSRALEDARAALGAALDGRGLEGVDEPDALLAIRARAVARTAERRHAQVWSAVGIVAVVFVAIAAIVLTRDHGGPRRAASAPAPLRSGPRGPGPWRGRPLPVAPSPFFFGWAVGVHVAVPLTPMPPPPAARAIDGADPLLESRGWFDGDEVELTAELLDPATGEVRWRRVLRQGADPRDAGAMGALVDRLLEGQPYGKRGAPTPPPRPAPAAAEGSSPSPAPPASPPADGPPGTDL